MIALSNRFYYGLKLAMSSKTPTLRPQLTFMESAYNKVDISTLVCVIINPDSVIVRVSSSGAGWYGFDPGPRQRR